MPRSESVRSIGERRSRLLRSKVAEELRVAREAAGLSARELGRAIGVGAGRIRRAEAGDPGTLTIDLASRLAAAVGLQLSLSFNRTGDPVRDRAHLALLGRLRARLPGVRLRYEVPIPITGDLRSGDVVAPSDGGDVLIEAETVLGDIQLIERRSAAKARDLGCRRLVLLVSDTPRNREAIRLHGELRERFPIGTGDCLRALAAGRDPGGDALVIL